LQHAKMGFGVLRQCGVRSAECGMGRKRSLVTSAAKT
jgi:hypothetical protein